MIRCSDLRILAQESLTDAEILLSNLRWKGAYYLCGYTVELALKERICRTLNWEGYPATNNEFQGFASFKTHDLDNLLRLSGVENDIRHGYRVAWYAVRNWNPQFRYVVPDHRAADDAQQMLSHTRIIVEALWNEKP